MNVLPKKRTQQFVHNLILLRSVHLPQGVSALRNLSIPRNIAALPLPNMKSVRNLASRIRLTSKTLPPQRILKSPNIRVISKNPFRNIFSYQFAWFSASLASYSWFMYWIATDILILHLPVNRVSPTNYLGALVSMGLIWGGNRVFKPSPAVVLLPVDVETPAEIRTRGEAIRKHGTRPPKLASSTVQIEPLPLAQPVLERNPEPPTIPKPRKRKVETASNCEHRIVSSLEIPDGCLTCAELIACLSTVGKKRSIVG